MKHKMALSLVLAYLAVKDETRPQYKKRAEARLDGLTRGCHYALVMTDAAIGSAPSAVLLDVIEVMRGAGPQPPTGFVSRNEAYEAWLNNNVEALVERWYPEVGFTSETGTL